MAEPKEQRWLNEFIDAPALRDLAAALAGGEHLAARGAWGSSSHLVAGAVRHHTGCPVLLVLAHLDDADEAVDDLSLIPRINARAFPALEVMPGETNVSLELLADRLDIVRSLADADQPGVLVAPIQALMQAVPPGPGDEPHRPPTRAGR
jgi:transcription-repair coupling factor (superfamily II helicase)